MRIGFIGLGIMGRPMAKHLIDAGHTLTVWNRSRPGIDELVAAGATAGASPADVASKSEVVFTMVGDSPDVEAVSTGKDGIIEGAQAGLIHIDCTTMSPAVAREHRRDLRRRRASRSSTRPVSGGEGGAINATLSIMVGGTRKSSSRCKPLLEVAGQDDYLLRRRRRRPDRQALQPGRRRRHQHGGLRGAGRLPRRPASPARPCSTRSQAAPPHPGSSSTWRRKMVARRLQARLQGLAPAEGPAPRPRRRPRELDLPLPAHSPRSQLFAAVAADGHGEAGTQALVKALEKLGDHKVGRVAAGNQITGLRADHVANRESPL